MYSEFPFKFIIQGDKKVYRNTRITVRIPENRKKLLEQWAKDDNCTVSDLVNNLERF